MIQSDNNNQDHSEDREQFKKNTPIPESYQDRHYNEKAHMSGSIQKNTIAHERANLNPNQEQRPDSKNPERNRDK
ncbi:hypothetical protein Q765_20295 [Flavobacterium rivuli WB 3.3-2 = DSM 21788]|uniref:Uncharacterized protein n=1 Tax=Flavobacterium rivuli WB 3.3-2 = DSM 21788 TaxID=1121895 RepID=A0A0A2LZT1_9FLAO|nr:hypothetical protein [Flavobacterium rivuli]KGO84693.1 hypothetical protein Q765_20295 [Flavobacterium rivuli WB 3.3-2 = DSM 21788]